MQFLEIPSPDWLSLPGGSAEASGWYVAQRRKLDLAASAVPRIRATARLLGESGALNECRPEVLLAVPDAAGFYIDLLGLSTKSLDAIAAGPGNIFGAISVKPLTLARRLASGSPVRSQDVTEFALAINAELSRVHPGGEITEDLAAGIVLAMEGGKIQGSVTAKGGTDAVGLLKDLLVAGMQSRGVFIEVSDARQKTWQPLASAPDLDAVSVLRFEKVLTCEMIAGGNRPDVKLVRRDVTLAVGEVKGRKDLSNVWESWMPQINGHLRTWTSQHPDAPRLFFGTMITPEMIEGITAGGTQHTGLRALHKNGLLTSAYNLSRIAGRDPASSKQFEALLDSLIRAF